MKTKQETLVTLSVAKVQELIRLSEAVGKATPPSDPLGVEWGKDSIRAAFNPPPALAKAEKSFLAALKALTHDELAELQALMYAGCQKVGDGFADFLPQMRERDDYAAEHVAGKGENVATYLREGLKRLKLA